MKYISILIIQILFFTISNAQTSDSSDKQTGAKEKSKVESKKSEPKKIEEKPRTKSNSPTVKKPVATSQNYKINYASSPWNVDSKKVDSAYLFFRDKSSNKVAKVLIEETEPDSSTFSGQFSIGFSSTEKMEPEVYVPPEDIRQKRDSLARFTKMLANQKIEKQPIAFRTDEDGNQILDVYDTEEQAQRAQEAFNREEELAKKAEQAKKVLEEKKVLDKAAMEAAKMAERQTILDRLAKEAAAREADRIRLEQIERQRAEERKRKQAALAKRERDRRINLAKQYAETALDFYNLSNFYAAEENFKKSVELDPSNTSYYFSYGVSQYRLEKYNEALITLKIAEDTPQTAIEKKYYLGLIHYRLAEMDFAIKYFREVKESKDKTLGPSAAFYEGLLLYNLEKYEEAQPAFEYVLDNSSDPALDKRAEEYIEKIARQLHFKRKQEKRLSLSVGVSAIYDSNVLLASDTLESQGTSLDKGGFRALLSGEAEYRFIYTRNHELAANYEVYYYYSVDDDFATADPFLNTFTLPYAYKTAIGEKGYTLKLVPGYEILFLDPNDTGSRESILDSIFLEINNTFVNSPMHFAAYNLIIQMDDSTLSSSTGDDDADAVLYTLETEHTMLLDKTKEKALVAGAGVSYNAAKGKNKKYHRLDLSVSYYKPTYWWNTTWNAGLSFYRLTYFDDDDDRKDTNVALDTGLTKPINDWFTWSLSANYTSNTSKVDSFQYSKYSITTTAIMTYD